MDGELYQRVRQLEQDVKAIKQRLGIREGGTIAVAMAVDSTYERPVRCPICDGTGTEEGETCRLCGGTGLVNSGPDGEASGENETD